MLPLKALVPAFLALHPHGPASPLDWKACRQGAPDRVIIACTSIVDLSGVNDAARAVALIARGSAYAAKKQPARALEDLRQATLLDPRNPDGFYALAGLYGRQGDLEQAILAYDSVIRLNPKHVLALTSRGYARASRREFDLAIADYDRALKFNPRHAEALRLRGAVHGLMGDDAGAIADLDRAIGLDGSNALAFLNRAGAYRKRGDFERALADYDRALQLKPGLPQAIAGRKLALERLRN